MTDRGDKRQMKEYIDGHIYENLSVPKLEEQVNLSVSQAGRLFKAAYRKTSYEYILKGKQIRPVFYWKIRDFP